jgi:succinoglycan biosynthesis protein ExoL
LAALAFFGHDANDAAVRRRIAAFSLAGADVRGYTMRRGSLRAAPTWDNIDLGETVDADFRQRLTALFRARPLLRRERSALRAAEIFYARNLDMLALAHWARAMSGSRARLVYECLDVHRLMTKAHPIGAAMRALERRLLQDTVLLIVSSPAFVREYFDVRHPGKARTMLVENRLPPGFDYGPRPELGGPRSGPIRLGWFGNLRCRRSLALMLDVAARFPGLVEIVMRGAPIQTDLADFETRIAGYPNVRFGGRYEWPTDLAGLYAEVDLVWAGDFFDPGANSKWLLPNRLYEGGYYGAPPLAPSDSETGRWIVTRNVGFTLPEPLEETLPAFFARLSRRTLIDTRARLLAAPTDAFAQPLTELTAILDTARA